MNPNLKPRKRSKMGNKKTCVGSFCFDSAKEARRYGLLALLERQGLIINLRMQVKYPLMVNGVLIASYVADFVYQKEGREIVEDVKSPFTRTLPVYRLKKKLMAAIHGIEIYES